MNRRQLLKLITFGVVGHTLDIDRLLWVPGQKTIFIPSDAQVAFLIKEFPLMHGLSYYEDNPYAGTWMGITRSTEPWNWREGLKKVCLDPTKPLYIVTDKDDILCEELNRVIIKGDD